MKKSQRLQRIVKLSATAEKRAAVTLAQAQQELSALRTQAQYLRNYQAEYLKNLQTSAAAVNSYSAQKLMVFVKKIEATLGMLNRKSELVERRYEEQREQWLALHRKVNALGEISLRARSAEEIASYARSQREMDDRPRPARELM